MAELAVGLALGFMLEGTGLFCAKPEEDAEQAEQPNAYESVAWRQILAHLDVEMTELPLREQTILREHYLNGVAFDHLSDLIGLSKGRVSQLHRSALALLRKRMRAHGHFQMMP